ncbi:MAG: PAS domain-containing sensor histidine kinase [bacterium]
MILPFKNAAGFIDNLPIGIYKATEEGSLIFKNNYINKILYKDKEFNDLSSVASLLFPSEIIKRIKELEILNNETIFTYKIYDFENKVLWLKNICKKVIDEEGIITIEGTIEDITKAKLVDDLLKENEERFRLLYERAPLGYQSLDENGNFLEVNQAWCNTLGYQKEEIIGKWFGDFLTPEYREKFRQNFPLFKKNGEINGIEFEMVQKSGLCLSVSFNGKIGYSLDGNFKQTHCILKDNSSEKKIALELKKEKELFQQYIDIVGIIILVLDKSQKIVLINKFGANLLGFNQTELVGKNWFNNFIPKNKKNDMRNFFDRIFNNNICEEYYENEILIKNGDIKIISWHNSFLTDEFGNPNQIICAGEDITEKKAEGLKYSTLFETMAQGVVYHDSTGRIISANPAAERILGLTLEQMQGKKSIDMDLNTIYEDGKYFPEYSHPASYTLKTGNIIKGVIMGVFNPTLNKQVWIRISTVPLFTPNKSQPSLVYATFEDITDMRNAENALKKSEERYRTFINSNVDLVFLKDDQYRYLMINKSYELFLGFTENEVIGKTDFELMPMEAATSCFKSDQKALSTNEIIISHEIIDDKVFQVQKFPVLLQNGKYGVGGYIRDVTEKYNIEAELKESEEKYRILVENQTELVVKVDNEGRFLFVSPSYCELFGKTEKELLGNNFIPLVHSDDQAATKEEMKNLYIPPYVCNVEQRAKTINGWRWLSWADKSILNSNNQVIAIIGVGRDITKRKNAEILLHESEEKFRQIAENIQEIFWLSNIEDNRILYISPMFELVWDVLREKIYDNTIHIFDNLHPLDKDRVLRDFNQLKTNKHNLSNIEYRIILKDGSIRWIHSRSFPIKNENGIIIRRITISEEITKLKQIQEKLEKFFAVSLDLLCIANTNGEFLLLNDTWEKTIGFSKDELIGKNFIDFVHPDDVANTIEAINQLSNQLEVRSFVNRYLCKDGSYKVLDWNSKPSGELIYAAARDITETKKQEETLKTAKDKAEKANNLKTEFLAQMSHEIRSPLNTVLNCSSLIKESFISCPDEEIKELFPIINSAGHRIIRTIDSLINMSEINLGTYEPNYKTLNIKKDILETICSELKILAVNKGLEFEVLYETDEKIIKADNYSVSQIFVNLIDNAIKYTKSGKIEVKVYINSKNRLAVDISDTGIGISQEFIPELFSAFRQEEQGYSRKFEGNGLGLALVKEYCNINNAIIEVQSTKDVGSKFTIIFNK